MRIIENNVISEFVDKLNSIWNGIKSDLYDKNIFVVTEKFGIPRGSSVDEKIGTVYRSDGFLKLAFLIDGKKSGLDFTPLKESRRPKDPQILYDKITHTFRNHDINISKIETIGWSITKEYFVNYVVTTDIKVRKITVE